MMLVSNRIYIKKQKYPNSALRNLDLAMAPLKCSSAALISIILDESWVGPHLTQKDIFLIFPWCNSFFPYAGYVNGKELERTISRRIPEETIKD